MTRAIIPSVKEPNGLTRSDGKRPNGFTSIPWHEGRSVTWDVTVTNTVAASYLAMSSVRSASAAEAAATRKDDEYIEISRVHLFYSIAFEIMGPINQVGQDFISELGRRISPSLLTIHARETSLLLQRLSVAVQRFNVVSFTYSFGLTQFEAAHLPKHSEAHHRVKYFYTICLISLPLGTEYQGLFKQK